MDRARLGIRCQRAVLVALFVALATEFVEGRGFAGFAESNGHGEARKIGKRREVPLL
jgi:hypothetical protein